LKRYNALSTYWKNRYKKRVQRLPVSAGLGCPNRKGGEEPSGCIFCDPTGSGFAAVEPDVDYEEQIREMINRTQNRYGKDILFAVYLQSYTNTYGSVEKLRSIYDRLFVDPRIVIFDIATRPDCVEEEKLDLITSYSTRVDLLVELGLQSTKRSTLVDLNRGHTLADFIDAVIRTRKRGIEVVAHMITDLPQDSKDDLVESARILSALGVEGVKLHSLYVVEGTELDRRIQEGRYERLGLKDFVERTVLFLEHLDPSIVIQRLVSDPPHEGAYGNWGLPKIRIIQAIEQAMKDKDTYQGKYFDYPGR